jgi:hypothetical protein
MKLRENFYQDLIRVRKNREMPEIYDVELDHVQELKSLSSLECHIVFYPYSRKVTSTHFEFTPFEEYTSDILASQKSAYTRIRNHFSNLFGLFLGIFIAAIFFVFKPSELVSIESIVSIIGAYFVGKELWEDIEDMLINMSKNWRIRYVENYYYYRLEKHTTLSLYSYLAKKRRYGKEAMLPEKMDMIQKRNSQTLRLFFNMKDLKSLPETSAHILSIRLDPELMTENEACGFMFGAKVSLNKRFLGITRHRELFQSLDYPVKGCLKENGVWIDNAVFYRNTFSLGRIKFFVQKGLLENKSILDIDIKSQLA